ncbi:MAG: hypothetical protein ACI9R3_005642 [Verrucomicrobiales bacterium]|jgi:hypothetical protein
MRLFDNDDTGRQGAGELAKRIGIERVGLVELKGYKDANEALQAGDSDAVVPERSITKRRGESLSCCGSVLQTLSLGEKSPGVGKLDHRAGVFDAERGRDRMSGETWWITPLLLPGGRMKSGRFEFPDSTGTQFPAIEIYLRLFMRFKRLILLL